MYDAIDILDQIQKLVAQPAIRIKTNWHYSIRHQLRQISHRGWEEWGLQKYRIEGVFESMKIKVNSVFTFFEHPEVKVINPGATVIWKLEQADNPGLVSVGFFAKCGDACFMYLVLFGQAYRYATQQG